MEICGLSDLSLQISASWNARDVGNGRLTGETWKRQEHLQEHTGL